MFLVLKKAQKFDKKYEKIREKKLNHYIISSNKRKNPKYITGYQIIDLKKAEKEESLKPKYLANELISPFITNNPNVEKQIQEKLNIPIPKQDFQPFEKREGFLPLEYYMIIDEEDEFPERLIDKYGNQGFSKWFLNNGKNH